MMLSLPPLLHLKGVTKSGSIAKFPYSTQVCTTIGRKGLSFISTMSQEEVVINYLLVSAYPPCTCHMCAPVCKGHFCARVYTEFTNPGNNR